MRQSDIFERDLLGACLDLADVGLCVLDEIGTVVLVNSTFCRQFEIIDSETIGRSCRRLLDNRATDTDLLDWLSQPGATGRYDLQLKSEGRERDLSLQSKMLTHWNGERFKVLAVTDVTVERGAQFFANRQRQWQAMNAGVVIADARKEDAPIVYVNANFERMTGYPPGEVIGRNCRFLQGAHPDQPGLQEIRQAISQGRNGFAVLKNFRKDGSGFLNELFVSALLNADGEVVHFIGVQHASSEGVRG